MIVFHIARAWSFALARALRELRAHLTQSLLTFETIIGVPDIVSIKQAR